jgi:hypothetical protein
MKFHATLILFFLSFSSFSRTVAAKTLINGTPSNLLILADKVEIKDLMVFRQSNVVNLTWTNQSESSIDQYVVERSENGKDFIAVAFQGALLNSSSIASYQTLDPFAGNRMYYYRIKTIDLAGKIYYSAIVKFNAGIVIIRPFESTSSSL